MNALILNALWGSMIQFLNDLFVVIFGGFFNA